MYSPTPLRVDIPDIEKVYLNKITSDIYQLEKQLKRSSSSDSQLQIRKRLAQLQAQLQKLEGQLTADLVSNSLAQWQRELSAYIAQTFLSSGETLSRAIQIMSFKKHNFRPCDEDFHHTFIKFLRTIPSSDIDPIIRAILILWPIETPNIPVSPYGYPTLMKSVPGDRMDVGIARPLVALFIVDALLTLTEKFEKDNLRQETKDILIQHGVFYYRNAKKLLLSNYSADIGIRWSLILGDLSITESKIVVRQLFFALENPKKFSSDEIISCLGGLRYIQLMPSRILDSREFASYIRDLCTAYDRQKKGQVRIAIVRALECLVRSFDFATAEAERNLVAGRAFHFSKEEAEIDRLNSVLLDPSLQNEAINLYYRAVRWMSANEEVRPWALSLMTTIMGNSCKLNFDRLSATFLYQDLQTGQTRNFRPYVYDSVLKFLRGDFVDDTPSRARRRLRGEHIPSFDAYSHIVKSSATEELSSTLRRLQEIHDLVIARVPISDMVLSLDTCADIVVQMACTNLPFVMKTTLPWLFTNPLEVIPEALYVATRALSFLLDKKAGFVDHAACRKQEWFSKWYNKMANEFRPVVYEILSLCERKVGVPIHGQEKERVLEVTPYNADAPREGLDPAIVEIFGADEPSNDASSSTHYSESPQVRTRQGSLNVEIAGAKWTIGGPMASGSLSPVSPTPPRSRSATGILFGASPGGAGTLGGEFLPVSVSSEELEPQLEANKRVVKAFAEWQSIAGIAFLPPARIDALSTFAVRSQQQSHQKYSCSSSVVSTSDTSLAPPHDMFNSLLREVIHLIPHFPNFLTGTDFLGTFLLHRQQGIAIETSWTLQRIFSEQPTQRIQILFGMTVLLQQIGHGDPVSLATLLDHIGYFVREWMLEKTVLQAVDDLTRFFYRLSDKLEASLLIALATPSARIRNSCLQILSDLATLENRLIPSPEQNSRSTLHKLITQNCLAIHRSAILGYLREDSLPSPPPPANILFSFPTVREVASSDFADLWAYYLGEIAIIHADQGRQGSVAWVIKILKDSVGPWMKSKEATNSNEGVSLWSAYMILFVAFGGMDDSMNSEGREEVPSHRMLFLHVKEMIWPALSVKSVRETMAVIGAAKYADPRIVEFFLLGLHNDYEENKNHLTTPAFVLGDLLRLLRTVSDGRDFPEILRNGGEDSAVGTVYTDFLFEAERCLEADCSGTRPQLEMLANFCLIVERVAEIVNPSAERKPWCDEFISIHWPFEIRKRITDFLFHIHTRILFNAHDRTRQGKETRMLDSVSSIVGNAVENFLQLGDAFGNEVSREVKSWLVKLELAGHRVIHSALHYNYENFIDFVLLHSYSSFSMNASVFFHDVCDHILDQKQLNLIHYNEDIRDPFLLAEDANGRRNGAVDVDIDNDEEMPDINMEKACVVKPFGGELLFFGIFHLLHTDLYSRQRAFLFLQHLLVSLHSENASEVSTDLVEYFRRLRGNVKARGGTALRSRILEFTKLIARLLPEIATAFVSEAIRCSQILEHHVKLDCFAASLLPHPRRWILDLLVPWCRNIHLNPGAQTEEVTKESTGMRLLAWILDCTFANPDWSDRSFSCLAELAASSKFGTVNAAVVCEFLIATAARCMSIHPDLINAAFMEIFSARPEILTFLIEQLSIDSHPDRKNSIDVHRSNEIRSGDSSIKTTTRLSRNSARQFAERMESRLNQRPVNPSSSTSTQKQTPLSPDQEYRARSVAASRFLFDLSLQDFDVVSSHLPTVLCYAFLHLPRLIDQKNDDSSVKLLIGVLKGYARSSRKLRTRLHADPVMDVKRILSILQLPYKIENRPSGDAKVLGNASLPSANNHSQPITIAPDEIVEQTLRYFEKDLPALRDSLIAEVQKWAIHPKLNADVVVNAVQLFGYLEPRNIASALEIFHGRLVGCIAQLQSLEENLRKAPSTTHPSMWESMSIKNKLDKKNAEQIVLAILNVHGTIIQQLHKRKSDLLEFPLLYWTSASLLHIPCPDFLSLYQASIENCALFIEGNAFLENVRDDDSHPFFNAMAKIGSQYPGMQPLLLQGIFGRGKDLEAKSVDLLLSCWCSLPGSAVDSSPTADLYTMLYVIPWIFVEIRRHQKRNRQNQQHRRIGEGTATDTASSEASSDSMSITASDVARKLSEALSIRMPWEYAAIVDSLIQVATEEWAITQPGSTMADDILVKISESLAKLFLKKFSVNIAEFFAFAMRLSPQHGHVYLVMLRSMWSAINNGYVSDFKPLVKRLPFLSENLNMVESVLTEIAHKSVYQNERISDLELGNVPRVDPFPLPVLKTGSVKMAYECLLGLGNSV